MYLPLTKVEKCVFVFFCCVLICFLSAAEITNSKLKYMYVLLICLAFGGGGKTGQEFPYILEWQSALLRLKTNERIPRNTKLSPETKSRTCEV